MKIKKRYIVIISVLLILAAAWVYFTFSLEVTHTEIRSSKINNEIKIVQLSDLHGMSFGKNNERLLNAVRKENPDIVAVTGDMFTYGDGKGEEVAISLLSELAKEFRIYFVNGEHDNNKEFLDILEKNGVNVLKYEDELVVIGNTNIHIYGITNVYFSSTFNLENAFEKDNAHFCLLLAHMQKFSKFAAFGMDLSLCGDTHGGLFRLPGIGALYDGETWFPDLAGKYVKGLYSFGQSKMFVSSGLGSYPVPLRFFNTPEVSVITLLPE